MYGIFFLIEAFAFYVAGYLRMNSILNSTTGKLYTGGEAMAIMFSVIMGAMAISALTPVVKIMTEGKIAGKLAFSVIDSKPIVNGNDPNAQKITSAS